MVTKAVVTTVPLLNKQSDVCRARRSPCDCRSKKGGGPECRDTYRGSVQGWFGEEGKMEVSDCRQNCEGCVLKVRMGLQDLLTGYHGLW